MKDGPKGTSITETINILMQPTTKANAWFWTCHICGKSRPDENINVRICTTQLEGGYEITLNIRYCNDRKSCRDASITLKKNIGL